MKNIITTLFVTLFTFIVTLSYGQQKFKASTYVGGSSLNRGDVFDYIIYGNGMNNATTRQLLFDVQYDKDNFEIVSVNHTGTGGNGGILPQQSTINLSWYNYPGYNFIPVTSGSSNNTTTNGTTNYQYAQYNYAANNPYAILRTTLSWATNSPMPYSGYSDFIKIKFRLKAASTAYTFNPIKLNFVAGWNAAGTWDNTIMETPLSTAVVMNQNFGKYVTAKVDLNSNLYNLSALKVSFRDTLTNQGVLFPITSTGEVDINQNSLAANKVYEVSVMHDMDQLYNIYNNAITISDFTSAQGEFTSMGLDGSNGQSLNTGQSLFAADINRNKSIDGGDLPPLLAQVAGIDTLMMLPNSYTSGSGGWMSLPTWSAADATTIAGQVEWAYVTVNGYSNGVSKLHIDVREFASGVTAEQIKSVQLFDVYTGPVEFVSNDGTWAIYRLPSSLTKVTDGSSTYISSIRNMQGSDYGFRAEFEMNTSVNNSWGSITKSNWKTITMPRTLFKTGTLGTNAVLDLKYLLWGDVNRSHSSQVVTMSGGNTSVQTNAVNSLATNTAFRTMAVQSNSTGTSITTPGSLNVIDVNLNNLTVTSNTIEIPVSIDTKGASVTGLQFEFTFDPAKIKFEELLATVPNTWYVFASSKDGRVKFGALDKNNSEAIKGTNVPFKLKFSTIGQGVDIVTSVKVSPLMDAADIKGNQLGINLNSTQIKLTGYNNF